MVSGANLVGKLKTAFVTAASVLLLLAVLEGVLRLLPPPERRIEIGAVAADVPEWVARDPDFSQVIAWMGDQKHPLAPKAHEALLGFLTLFEQDRELHYRLKPDLAEPVVNWHNPRSLTVRETFTLDSNGQGFRGPELEGAKAPGVFRVFCLGGSIAYGWGVEEDETYAARLRRALAERAPGRFEVYNLGSPGFTTFQGRLLFERLVELEPDLVTCNFINNDQELREIDEKTLHARKNGTVGRFAALLFELRTAQILRALSLRLAGDRAAQEAGPDDERVPRVGPADFRANLEHIVSLAAEHGARTYVVDNSLEGIGLPERRASNVEYASVMAQVTELHGIPLVRFYTLARAAVRRMREAGGPAPLIAAACSVWGEKMVADLPRLVYQTDLIHPSPEGHALIAERILLLMQRDGFLADAGTAGMAEATEAAILDDDGAGVTRF